MKAPNTTMAKRFPGCERGVAAVEFALVLPALLALLMGTYELSRYIVLNQKLEHLAYITADVIGQETSITQAQINDVMSAATEIIEPFEFGADGVVIVSSIEQDPADGPVVRWQVSGGGTLGHASELGEEDEVAELPRGLTLEDNENIIVAEVFYNYTPLFSEQFVTAKENYKYAVFKPRYGSLTSAPN